MSKCACEVDELRQKLVVVLELSLQTADAGVKAIMSFRFSGKSAVRDGTRELTRGRELTRDRAYAGNAGFGVSRSRMLNVRVSAFSAKC